MEDISKIIKILFVLKNTTPTETATKIGWSRQKLQAQLSRNDMRVSDLKQIADGLGLELKLQFLEKETKKIVYPLSLD